MTRDELLAAWDAFADDIRRRISMGHDLYGTLWERRGIAGNCAEAQMEEADAVAYMFFAWLLARERGAA